MSSDSTTEARWPVLRDRAPFVQTAPRAERRRPGRSAWLLTGLAFLCGGLVSAAVFSIGWRHQAQRDTAARSALAAAEARTRRLEQQRSALRTSLGAARGAEARAIAAERAVEAAGASLAAHATSSSKDASSISAGAGSVAASAARIASELKTLDTYLTTTPAGQLDPGYINTQAAYLTRQLTKLQTTAGGLGNSVGTFEAATRKVARIAAGLSHR